MPFPGLYDPLTAGDVSPLLSAFEAARCERPPGLAADAFPLDIAARPGAGRAAAALEDVCARTRESGRGPGRAGRPVWSLLDATLGGRPAGRWPAPRGLTYPHRSGLSAEHGRMLAAIEHYAAVGESALA